MQIVGNGFSPISIIIVEKKFEHYKLKKEWQLFSKTNIFEKSGQLFI